MLRRCVASRPRPYSSSSPASAAPPVSGPPSRPPWTAIALGGFGLTPFVFYGLQVAQDASAEDARHSPVSPQPWGDALLRRWSRHLPLSGALEPVLAAFECGDQAGARLRFVSYSSVILAFLGGVHWGAAIAAPAALASAGPSQGARALALAGGVLPSLIAWPAPTLAANGRSDLALAVLPLGFLFVFAADQAAVRARLLPPSYLALRAPLTLAVVGVHLMAAARLRSERRD